ncbi:YbjQ family protein [Pseudoalteromonas distincta]|uniref:YbjQ family protein n=1 Tax=Pseudoalteromonas distincta TaxID=77608 RepID=UPI00242C8EA6|nr:YbjQ family protein [Pseudoalteromonas distincta]|tara:strand:+ start:629 stop:1537 length:909 start_codon:yes stop_codon:yes gene_type:complete
MFFSKKSDAEIKKEAPQWNISEKGLTDNINNIFYETAKLATAERKDSENNTHITVWYEGKYITNLLIESDKRNPFDNFNVRDCDDFIEDLPNIEFEDKNASALTLSVSFLIYKSKRYPTSSLRTQETDTGYEVYSYGNFLTIVNEDAAKNIEKAKHIYLSRKYGLANSSLRDHYSKLQLEKIESTKVANLDQNEILLTTETTPSFKVIKRLDVITSECVYGMNIFKDIFASLSDTFGGRNESIQNTLRDARKTALAELRKEAFSLGANAVIGIDLDYSEISGGGKSGMLFIVASGTAVIVED